MYEMQQLLRQFEKRAYDMFLQNLVKGTSHLSLGQEAVATGFGRVMRPDDFTFATYRGHAHTLARGADPGAVLAELLGRENGILKGKGGSMHLTSVEHGMMGSYAIIGAHLTIANGAAWSARMRGTDQVAVCFFGDGTTNIGAFHEALNLAAIWDLPVVFVCENNLWMEYTPIDLITAVANPAADRASAYGLEGIVVDGNDADAVYQVATQAIGRARRGEGPSLGRGPDLPGTRAQSGGPGEIPPPRRGAGLEGAGPDPDVPREIASPRCPGRRPEHDPARRGEAGRRGDRIRQGRRGPRRGAPADRCVG